MLDAPGAIGSHALAGVDIAAATASSRATVTSLRKRTIR
jgi:hypothetical protein